MLLSSPLGRVENSDLIAPLTLASFYSRVCTTSHRNSQPVTGYLTVSYLEVHMNPLV